LKTPRIQLAIIQILARSRTIMIAKNENCGQAATTSKGFITWEAKFTRDHEEDVANMLRKTCLAIVRTNPDFTRVKVRAEATLKLLPELAQLATLRIHFGKVDTDYAMRWEEFARNYYPSQGVPNQACFSAKVF